MQDDVRLIDLYHARHRLHGHIVRTPLVASPSLSRRCGGTVHLKLECRQLTGSFKLRGAANALLQLPAEARARGVIGVSTGNYGRALAYAAHRLGVRAVICMSRLVPANKVEAIRALGAEGIEFLEQPVHPTDVEPAAGWAARELVSACIEVQRHLPPLHTRVGEFRHLERDAEAEAVTVEDEAVLHIRHAEHGDGAEQFDLRHAALQRSLAE